MQVLRDLVAVRTREKIGELVKEMGSKGKNGNYTVVGTKQLVK